MFHARKLAFCNLRVRTAKKVRNNQSQNRVAEKLQRFVVQLPRLFFIAGGNLFVRPGPMSYGTLKQGSIAKIIS